MEEIQVMQLMQASWTAQAEELAGKLARFSGPTFRKAYLSNLLASGSRLSVAGDLRSGSYCFEKVGQALKSLVLNPDPVSHSGEKPTSANTHGNASENGSEDASELSAEVTAETPEPPLEKLRHHWRKDRLLDAEAVLRRQGGRLSTLENKIYGERLEKLKASGKQPTSKSQSGKLDASLLDLRTQLYRRVLKSQKVSLRQKRAPGSGTLRQSLLLPKNSKDAAITRLDAIVGPYNDRYNIADLLTLISHADAVWVEEFLDLYRGLLDLKGMNATAPSATGKK